MAKLGLDHRSLERVNPRIITCSLTGFGESGPYADRPGYDYTIQALTGVMSLTGEPDGPPAKAGISYVDHSGALSAALAICAGLVGRMTTGRGRHIDLGLLDTQVSMLTYLAAWQMNSSYQPERLSNSSHPSLVPAQNFRTADGYLSLFVGNDAMWRRLVEALDDKVLASPRFSTREGREAGRKDLLARLQELLAGDSSLGWAKRLAEAGVACAPVNTLSAGLADPHVSARGLLAEARHGAYGDYAHTRGPVPAMSSASTRGAPLLGEHTVEILLDLGYSKERVDSLIESGVVCCPPKS
jgi:crotonobetainyl-CoA:carnitine CoA-transferase CaiB-like acyl-CoA transferase